MEEAALLVGQYNEERHDGFSIDLTTVKPNCVRLTVSSLDLAPCIRQRSTPDAVGYSITNPTTREPRLGTALGKVPSPAETSWRSLFCVLCGTPVHLFPPVDTALVVTQRRG